MQNFKLVLPEHLNSHGYLFGGNLLRWIDEVAYIAVNIDFPDHSFVTIGLDKVEFHHGIREGVILRFETEQTRLGTTSATYHVQVFDSYDPDRRNVVLFETQITFVNTVMGRKAPINQTHQLST